MHLLLLGWMAAPDRRFEAVLRGGCNGGGGLRRTAAELGVHLQNSADEAKEAQLILHAKQPGTRHNNERPFHSNGHNNPPSPHEAQLLRH
jgi:hypothetical protein